jgi:HPt (histidine-containing phosphotransfer) domain-containing protein
VLLAELPMQEQALARAVEQNNPAQIRHLAHGLKNSAAMLHLQQLRAAGAALEKAAQAQQDCRQAWRLLKQAMPVARDTLRAYVGSRTDGL